jgi:glycosyltransferase involved in cell wall biosynthesis
MMAPAQPRAIRGGGGADDQAFAMRRLQVNFVFPGYTNEPVGGYRVIYEYADFLAGRGHGVRLIFPMFMSVPATHRSRLERTRRLVWRMKTRLRNRPLVPWHVFHPQVRMLLVPEVIDAAIPDADVSVATGWSTAQPVADLARSKGEKFYVIQHHETMMGPADAVNATWLLPLRKIVIAKWLEEVGQRLGARDLRHIPNGINFKLFDVRNPPTERPMHIISLFHDQAFKGVPDALAVLQAYHGRHPQVPVTMFGVPERAPDLPPWITYARNPSQRTLVQEIYNRGTIYLGASLLEGWGLPPAEAMACGCAFVGTDIGGFREFARHEETALLSPAGDRATLLANLERMTRDQGLRTRIQRSGTEHIRHFTWERAGGSLESYFLEYAGRAPGTA